MSLKDALMKAGYKSTKNENERQRKLKKEKSKVEKHQEHRNFCEVCEFIQPDVERFKHKNPLVDAEWICSNCADKNEILDDFRVTNQSDSARNGRYRRYYGPMKDFSKEKDFVQKPKKNFKKRNNNGNSDSRGNRSSRYTLDENGEKNFNC
jgi:ribosomal protein L37AE/L43A